MRITNFMPVRLSDAKRLLFGSETDESTVLNNEDVQRLYNRALSDVGPETGSLGETISDATGRRNELRILKNFVDNYDVIANLDGSEGLSNADLEALVLQHNNPDSPSRELQLADFQVLAFRQLDSDGNGSATQDELLNDLRRDYPAATDTELRFRLGRYLMYDNPGNPNGELDFSEFVTVSNDVIAAPFNPRLDITTTRTLMNIFNRYDVIKRDGVLDRDELELVDPQRTQHFLNSFDVDRNGVVSFGEALGESVLADPTLIDHIADVFKRHDASSQFGNHHDGFLRRDALRAAIKDLTPNLTFAQRRDIYRRLVNQYGGANGAIDLSEFITFMFNELTGNNVA